MTTKTSEILDLARIYGADFSYSLPRTELEKYFSGRAFDHKENYTPEQQARLHADITRLYEQVIPKQPSQYNPPEAILTAGGPGVGKTMLMRSLAQSTAYPYICPDDVCLREGMPDSYLADIIASNRSATSRLELYNRWRPGSNAATHLILANLIRKKHPFYFGTTSSGPFTWKLLELLQQQGYQITLLHVSSPTDICFKSLQKRDQTFIQTTEEDVRNKALLVPQRVHDTYFKYASKIEFYYRDEVDSDARLAATWIRTAPEYGSLAIQNQADYRKIQEIHDAVATQLQRPELYWKECVEKKSTLTP